jgi:uncharacterized membrane protein YeaQ/YmgE (transglycosylase-associated protein family)
MNFILWLIIGGILGWIASLIMGTDAQQGVFLNIVVGVIGALLAGFLLTPLFGVGTINQNNFSLPALLVSLLGAIVSTGHRESLSPWHSALSAAHGYCIGLITSASLAGCVVRRETRRAQFSYDRQTPLCY